MTWVNIEAKKLDSNFIPNELRLLSKIVHKTKTTINIFDLKKLLLEDIPFNKKSTL